MAFLNAMGRVSRQGQWRLRRTIRVSLPDGRLDLSEAGLVDVSHASLIVLTVTPRPPLRHWGCEHGGRCDPSPVLTASTADGTLRVANPGIVEALFPDGWGRRVPPGLYDVRIALTIGPETAVIFEEPVELR
jgi:hypothetical protein